MPLSLRHCAIGLLAPIHPRPASMSTSTATQNPRTYLAPIAGKRVLLAIVGKDPFPTGAIDIPFCKAHWPDLRHANCATKAVLASLGYPIDTDSHLPTHYETPLALFHALRDLGIVFLNASYQLVGDQLPHGPFRSRPIRKRDLAALEHAYAINQPILDAADHIILCGDAKRMHWVTPDLLGRCVVHPAIRNSHSSNDRVKQQWHEVWAPNFWRDELQLPPLQPSSLLLKSA